MPPCLRWQLTSSQVQDEALRKVKSCFSGWREMNMPGESSDLSRQLYVNARRVLLDALEALQGQHDAIILVGAQAIYQYTGQAKVAVAEFTTDADLVLDPSALNESPEIAAAMQSKGFTRDLQQPGVWWSPRDHVEVDLMVHAALAGPGTRAARLPGHEERAARRAQGLEVALVDKQQQTITALDPTDARSFQVQVAGPAALLIAKLYKIWERRNTPSRLDAKDASDVY